MSQSLHIHNIGELIVVPPGPIPGSRMDDLQAIADAVVHIESGKITWFGPQKNAPPPGEVDTLNAEGGCVVPGLIDCHTHTVFAGTREREFAMRLRGKSYAEIAEAGGGIRTTVSAVREAIVDELVSLARPRLHRMLRNGVTTVEIKSGYGLTVDDERKMLRAIQILRGDTGQELVATYLAAHTTPVEFAGRPDAYLDVVMSDDVLGAIREEGLAEFCDVFCEGIAFDVDQSRRVLEAGLRFGLAPRVHADQIQQIGASRMAGDLGAVSADHLEVIDAAGLAAMKAGGTVAVLLPACSMFLGGKQAPARGIIEADIPVAVATDYNPGSSMVESLPLTMHLACTQMGTTVNEALTAATANAAAVLQRQDRLGAMADGMQADLVVLDVPNLARWMYEPGRNCVAATIKAGRVVTTHKQSSG